MNPDEAEEFLDQLEGQSTLKEPYIIPKRKLEVKKDDEDLSGQIKEDVEAKKPKISPEAVTSGNVDGEDMKTQKSEEPESVATIHEKLYLDPLPPQASALCMLAKCQICDVELSSYVVAKSHYYGNPHRKNLTKFIHILGIRLPRIRVANKQTGSLVLLNEDEDPVYCKICDVNLQSEVVAESHYRGKNHAKKVRKLNSSSSVNHGTDQSDVVKGETPLSKIKPVDSNRRIFHCFPCKTSFETDDEYTKHVLGEEHKNRCKDGKQVLQNPMLAPSSANSSLSSDSPSDISRLDTMLTHIRKSSELSNEWRCDLCKVEVTSEVNYRMHIAGNKHKKKLQLELNINAPPKFRCDICGVITQDESVLKMHFNGKKHAKMVAMASGQTQQNGAQNKVIQNNQPSMTQAQDNENQPPQVQDNEAQPSEDQNKEIQPLETQDIIMKDQTQDIEAKTN